MNEIASSARITQAELARRCNLSVAMVNNYMKELCSAGLLEYRRKSSKSVSYYLTPAGKEQIVIIERELMSELAALFGSAKERIWHLIASQVEGDLNRVVLLGTGTLAELVYHALESADVDIVGVCDDNPDAVGREWCGREVLNPSQIRFIAPDAVIIASDRRDEDACSSLKSLVQKGIRLIRLGEFGCNGGLIDPPLPLGVSP